MRMSKARRILARKSTSHSTKMIPTTRPVGRKVTCLGHAADAGESCPRECFLPLRFEAWRFCRFGGEEEFIVFAVGDGLLGGAVGISWDLVGSNLEAAVTRPRKAG